MFDASELEKLTEVNRFEVINWLFGEDDFGRAYTKWMVDDFEVRLDIQDSGKTLKVFLVKKEEEIEQS